MHSIKIHTGFMQALALQTTLGEEQDLAEQQVALGKQGAATLAAMAAAHTAKRAAPPAVYVPATGPHRLSWAHNLRRFLRLLGNPMHSSNPYNDHRFFAHAPVLAAGWMYPDTTTRFAPGRLPAEENTLLVMHLQKILEACGFDKRCPVLFDRDGQVLDGYHRMVAARQSMSQVYFLQLNF